MIPNPPAIIILASSPSPTIISCTKTLFLTACNSKGISFESDYMKLVVDNKTYEIDLKEVAKQSSRLFYASDCHRKQFEIDGAAPLWCACFCFVFRLIK